MTDYKITYTNKSYPSSGVQPVENIPLKVMKMIEKWTEATPPTASDMSAVAKDLLNVVYATDFSGSGKHWSYDGCSSESVPSSNENEHIFSCEVSHTWDWKDIYSVARAEGLVKINWKEKVIFIQDYYYYCSG